MLLSVADHFDDFLVNSLKLSFFFSLFRCLVVVSLTKSFGVQYLSVFPGIVPHPLINSLTPAQDLLFLLIEYYFFQGAIGVGI